MGVCNCSMLCCTLIYVHSSIAIILMWKRELVALLNLSSCCLVMVEQLFLKMSRGCMRFVIVVFPDHTHYFRRRAPSFKESYIASKISKSWLCEKKCKMQIIPIFFKAFGSDKSTLRDVSYNARWFWTTIRYGPMTTAYLCWTTGDGF